jgi:hypothetical protein
MLHLNRDKSNKHDLRLCKGGGGATGGGVDSAQPKTAAKNAAFFEAKPNSSGEIDKAAREAAIRVRRTGRMMGR